MRRLILAFVCVLCARSASAFPLLDVTIVYPDRWGWSEVLLNAGDVPTVEPHNQWSRHHELYLNEVLISDNTFGAVSFMSPQFWISGRTSMDWAPTDHARLDIDINGFAPQTFAFAVPQPIPEPATWLLLGAGLVRLWRQRKRA